MAHNKKVQPSTRRHQDKREELARNRKGNTVVTHKRLETFHPLTHIKWKDAKRRRFYLQSG
jgi:hypothetical protein